MPVDLHDDLIELEIDALAAVPHAASADRSCYPLPRLEPTGAREKAMRRCVVLENEFLAATFLVGLGGRLHSLLDKRTGIETLAGGASLAVEPSGPRGAWIESGLQIVAGLPERPNALGPVDVLPCEPQGPDDVASLVLHELIPGLGLSWHATFSLAPDRAELTLDFRMLNRGFRPTPGASGVRCAAPRAAACRLPSGAALWQADRDAGLLFGWERGRFEEAEWADPALLLHHDGAPGPQLGPRQSASWSLTIAPFSGTGGVSVAADGVVASASARSISLAASRPLGTGKLFLMGRSGQALEAPVDLAPGPVAAFALEGPAEDPDRWLVRTEDGVDRIGAARGETLERWQGRTEWTPVPLEPCDDDGPRLKALDGALSAVDSGGDPVPWLAMAERDPRVRPASLVLQAMRALRDGDPARGDALLEDALGSNADDALAWWLKAACRRHLGAAGEPTELLNAHYLAPLEPALRAEALLGGSRDSGGSARVLEPLEGDPESLVEVACLLLDAGLCDDASVWLDEAIRLRDGCMLRLLAAWNHLRTTGMETEAAIHLRAASALPEGPPFPWRDVERRALDDLGRRFPENPRIASLARAAGVARP